MPFGQSSLHHVLQRVGITSMLRKIDNMKISNAKSDSFILVEVNERDPDLSLRRIDFTYPSHESIFPTPLT